MFHLTAQKRRGVQLSDLRALPAAVRGLLAGAAVAAAATARREGVAA